MNKLRYRPLAMLVLALALALAGAAHAAEQRSADSRATVAESARAFGQAIKREAKAVGAAVKEGANRWAQRRNAARRKFRLRCRASNCFGRCSWQSPAPPSITT